MNFGATTELQGVLALAFVALLLIARGARERWRAPALAVLAVAALYAYSNLLGFHPGFGAAHPYEFYHYYVGTKYFEELGYTGLYEATVVADHEDDPGGFDPRRKLLDPRSYRHETRGQVMERAASIRGRFSDARWQDFKADVAFFRAQAPALWRSGRIQRDHGYNGTPFTTWLLGGLAHLPVDAASFVAWAAWLDPALVLGTAALVAMLAGPWAGLLFVFLWAANPFNAYGYIGGAYLRHLYLCAWTLAIVCFWKGRARASGALLGLASLVAVFPALSAVGLALRDVLHAERRQELRQHAGFYLAFGASLALGVAISSVALSRGAGPVWLEFREAISVHTGALSTSHVGLASALAYDPDHDLRAIKARPRGAPRDWKRESAATLESRRLAHRGTQVAALALLVWFLRGAAPAEAWFAAWILLWSFSPASHYYYASLCAAPFAFGLERRSLIALAALWIGVALLRQVAALDAVLDRLMAALSVLIGAWWVAQVVGSTRARSG